MRPLRNVSRWKNELSSNKDRWEKNCKKKKKTGLVPKDRNRRGHSCSGFICPSCAYDEMKTWDIHHARTGVVIGERRIDLRKFGEGVKAKSVHVIKKKKKKKKKKKQHFLKKTNILKNKKVIVNNIQLYKYPVQKKIKINKSGTRYLLTELRTQTWLVIKKFPISARDMQCLVSDYICPYHMWNTCVHTCVHIKICLYICILNYARIRSGL